MQDLFNKSKAPGRSYVPIAPPVAHPLPAPVNFPVTVDHPMPAPPVVGYSPNPFIRSTFPGLETVDSIRQGYIPGIKLRRFLPVSNF